MDFFLKELHLVTSYLLLLIQSDFLKLIILTNCSLKAVIPEWAKDEEGNNLFFKASAYGAISDALYFKSSAIEYIETKLSISSTAAAGTVY